jgi:hypothetical protein
LHPSPDEPHARKAPVKYQQIVRAQHTFVDHLKQPLALIAQRFMRHKVQKQLDPWQRRQRLLRGILCMQRCSSGQRGAASELAWRLEPLSRRHLHRLRCFYRIASIGATVSPNTVITSPAALRLPDGSLLRKPLAGSPAGSRKNHHR